MRRFVVSLIGVAICLFVSGQGCPPSETPPTIVENSPPPTTEEQIPPVVNNPPPTVTPPVVVKPSKTDLDNLGVYLLDGSYDCVTLSGSRFNSDGQLVGGSGGVSKFLTVEKDFDREDQAHSLIKFSLVGKPSLASRVELKLLCSGSYNPPEMYLERITSPWGQFAGDITTNRSSRRIIPKATSGQWCQIDITDWYNSWQNGGNANFGFVLRPVVTGSGGWAQFYSNRYDDESRQPRLYVITGSPALTKYVFPFREKYSPSRLNYYRFGEWWDSNLTYPVSPDLKHTGLDIGAEIGEEVRVIKGGKVVYARPDSVWGGYVVVEHPGPYTSTYEHLLPVVTESMVLVAGQLIGTMVEVPGSPIHLHLHIRRGVAEHPWVLRGRLPTESRVVNPGGPIEPAWPEKFMNPDALDWE